MLRYTSLQNWTIGQRLIELGRRAEPIRGSMPSAWMTDANEFEIRGAAALSGVVQLEIQHVGGKELPVERILVRKIGERWQPVDRHGSIVRGSIYNADGTGYRTRGGAAEAAQMLHKLGEHA
jgi:hypothetical protein